jgi:hypothetical protein
VLVLRSTSAAVVPIGENTVMSHTAERAVGVEAGVPDLPGVPNLVPDVIPNFLGGQLLSAVSELLAELTRDFSAGLTAPVGRFVLSTPDILAEPLLRRVWGVSFACLLLLAALAVGISGVAMITGRLTSVGQAARESVGVRLPTALLTAAVSLPLVALEVELANALCQALLSVDSTGRLGKGELPGVTAPAAGGAGAGLALLVTLAVGVVLLVSLVVLALARWATLWLLIVLAPLAAAFGLLPGGGGVLRVWWRLQLVTVFLPVANAALLATYLAMFRSEQTGLLGALSGVAVLALLTKLPAWASGTALGLQGAEVSGRARRGSAVTQRVLHTVGSRAGTGGGGQGSRGTGGASAVRRPMSMSQHSMSPVLPSPAPGNGSAAQSPRSGRA